MTNPTKKSSTVLAALGLESIDDVITTAVPEVEPTVLIDVTPGEAEELEIELKNDDSDVAETVATANTFGEVAEGLESIRDRLVSLRGTQVSQEAFAFAGEAIRTNLRRIQLTPKNVAGLEAFVEAIPAVGVAPAADVEVKATVDEANLGDATSDADVSKAEADKAKAPIIGAGEEVIEGKGVEAGEKLAAGTEDDADVGGTGDTTTDASKVDDIAATAAGTDDAAATKTEGDAAVDAAAAELAAAATDAPVVDAAAAVVADTPRVAITITDDELNVAIEGLDNFIYRLEAGQEGLLDTATKAVGDKFAKFFKGYESVAARANNVLVNSKGLTGEAKKAEVSTSSANKLAFGGKVDLASITAGLKATKAVGKIVTEDVPKATAKLVAAAAKDYVKRTEDVRKGIVGGLTDHDFEAFTAADTKQFETLSKLFPANGGTEFIGGKKLVVAKEEAAGGGSVTTLTIEDVKSSVGTSATLKTLTPVEIATLAKSVLDVSKYLLNNAKVVEIGNKELREALASVSELHTDENTKRLGASLKKARWIFAWINRSYNSVINDFSNNTFSSLRSAIAVAEQSAAQYTGAKKAE